MADKEKGYEVSFGSFKDNKLKVFSGEVGNNSIVKELLKIIALNKEVNVIFSEPILYSYLGRKDFCTKKGVLFFICEMDDRNRYFQYSFASEKNTYGAEMHVREIRAIKDTSFKRLVELDKNDFYDYFDKTERVNSLKVKFEKQELCTELEKNVPSNNESKTKFKL